MYETTETEAMENALCNDIVHHQDDIQKEESALADDNDSNSNSNSDSDGAGREPDTEAIMAELLTLYPDADAAREEIIGYVSGTKQISAEDAYKVVNFDRLIDEAAKRAATEAQGALMSHIRLYGVRPAENGTDRKNGGKRQAPVSRLSRADRAKIAARAGRGERIEF